MCRNIKTLHNFEPPATAAEIADAALQYVRKISGMRKPSKANGPVFDRAVAEIEAATSRLVTGLTASSTPRDRETERARAQARWRERANA